MTHRSRHDEWKGSDRWDWSSVVFILLIVVIVLVLTFALWGPHPFPHQ